MTITVTIDQIVVDNPQYVTCEGGDFDAFQLVLCRRIDDEQFNTCAFLAASVAGIIHEL